MQARKGTATSGDMAGYTADYPSEVWSPETGCGADFRRSGGVCRFYCNLVRELPGQQTQDAEYYAGDRSF